MDYGNGDFYIGQWHNDKVSFLSSHTIYVQCFEVKL